MASPFPHATFRAEVRFANSTEWIPVGTEESRTQAEAALGALVRSWTRMGRAPLDARVLEIVALPMAA